MLLAPDLKTSNSFKLEEELPRLVDKIIQSYPVDQKEIYVAGISSGSLFSRWMLFSRQKFWRGAVFIAVVPYGNWYVGPGEKLPPLLFIHGQKDKSFHVEKVAELVDSLRKSGVNTELIIHPDAGHEVKPEWGKEVFDWIEKELDHS